MDEYTIFALSSGVGLAGVAIFRLSGPAALPTLARLTGLSSPTARVAHRVVITHSETQEIIDDGLALYFQGPKSFTGEDIVELHLHGGRAVFDEITTLLSDQPNLRPAEAGEFTRRAFDNGKLDLTAAEGLADLINAETAAQRRQAQRQLRGELATIYNGWRGRLLKAIAIFEAEIDFSDEDLPADLRPKVERIVSKIQVEISEHLLDSERGRFVRDGFQIAIVGPPNAGKSSLLNNIAGRDIAIVSEVAGTTRDVIEVHLDLGGYPVVLADTAGLRESSDGIESLGVQRALDWSKNADFRLTVFDGANWPKRDATTQDVFEAGNALAVVNKSDLGFDLAADNKDNDTLIGVSARTGDGLDDLLEKLTLEVTERCHLSTSPAMTRKRHLFSLQKCSDSMERFALAPEAELAAEDLRLASQALGEITGRINVEEVLDIIFKDFCIGK